jgi:hypothetical protein
MKGVDGSYRPPTITVSLDVPIASDWYWLKRATARIEGKRNAAWRSCSRISLSILGRTKALAYWLNG